MGAFCTKSICNLDKGDDDYAKLTDRSNMDAKRETNAALSSIDTNQSDPITPQVTQTAGPEENQSHARVPTPSLDQIQHAMNHLYLLAQTTNKENQTTARLPTLGTFDVSNIKLANPFGSPAIVQSTNTNGNGSFAQAYQSTIPQILPDTYSNNSSSQTTNINNIHIITSINNPEIIFKNESDIAQPAVTPEMLNNFSSDTVVVHANEQLALTAEGSSSVKDETNAVFSPPNISSPPVHSPITEEPTAVYSENTQPMSTNMVASMVEKESVSKTPISPIADSGKTEKRVRIQETEVTEESELETDIDSDTDREAMVHTQNRVRRSLETNDRNQLLRLKYDDTTVQSSVSDDCEDSEDDMKATPKARLLREESEFKWKKKDLKNNQKQMQAQIKKLEMEQEMAQMQSTLNYYRQQTGPY